MSIPPNHLETVLDTHGQPLIAFWHYQSEQVLYARWFGNITAETVVRGAQQATALQSWLHCPFILNDKHEATGDWSEAMTWLEYEWLPQAMKDGLRAVAYVFATDVSNQIVSLEFMKRVQPHIAIEMFYDVSMAWDWLVSQPQPRSPV